MALITGDWNTFFQRGRKVSDISGVKNFISSQSRNFDEAKDADATCSICLVDFKDNPTQKIAQLNCSGKHIFHADCLKSWVEKNDICPLCREKIPTK